MNKQVKCARIACNLLLRMFISYTIRIEYTGCPMSRSVAKNDCVYCWMGPPLCLIHKWFGCINSAITWRMVPGATVLSASTLRSHNCAVLCIFPPRPAPLRDHPGDKNPTRWDRGSSPATPHTVGVPTYYLLFQTYWAPCRLTVCNANACSEGRRRLGISLVVLVQRTNFCC